MRNDRTNVTLLMFIKRLKSGVWPFSIPMGYKEGQPRFETVQTHNGTSFRNRKIVVRTIEIDHPKAIIVNEIFGKYITGRYTFEGLARDITMRYGTKFVRSFIERTIANRFYIGEMVYKDIMYPHTYRTFVNKSDFDKAQMVKRIRGNGQSKSTYGKHKYAYKGLIKCAKCDSLFTAEKQKGHIYYHCSVNKCKRPYTREEDIEEAFRTYFNRLGYWGRPNPFHNYNGYPMNRIPEELCPPIDEQLEKDISFFSDNCLLWWNSSQGMKKQLLIKFLFKNILFHNENMEMEIISPFNGGVDIDFSIYDFYKIIEEYTGEVRSVTSIPTPRSQIQNSSEIDTKLSPREKIFLLCRNPISTDSLLDALNINIIELQEYLLDLQLDDLIIQDSLGLWRLK